MTTLYTVPTANGQRASIALEECAIAYDARTIELLAGEHRSEPMLAISPFGRMPVLQTDAGDVIYGSMAIARHAARQSGTLLPSDSQQDAADHWSGVIMTDLAPAFAAQFYLGVLAPEKDEWGLNFYAGVIENFLGIIDAHLAANAFFLADGYSLVDVLFYPTAATSIPRLSGGLEQYPGIARWQAVVAARDAVQRGMAVSS